MTSRPTRRNQRREIPDPLVTLDEVGEELGVSAQYARIIELRALKKLRKGLELLGFMAADVLD